MTHRRLLMLLLISSAVLAGHAPARGDDSIFSLLPDTLLLIPCPANPQEPRTGIQKEFGSSRLELDLGASLDLIAFSIPASDAAHNIHLGVEGFAYAQIRSYQDLRLQVTTFDGYIGGHVIYRPAQLPVFARLRLMHMSSHLVDGEYDTDEEGWIDGRLPSPFLRDYAEIIVGCDVTLGGICMTVYAGFDYAWNIRPDTQERWQAHAGFSAVYPLTGNVVGQSLEAYTGAHWRTGDVEGYPGIFCAELGAKIGRWTGQGLRVFVAYITGREQFSQFFDQTHTSWRLGCALDIR